MRHVVLSLATLALLVVVAGSCAVRELEDALVIPADAAAGERVVVIAAGVDMRSVVRRLAEADLFARPRWVRFYADHLREPAAPVPGEYALSRDLSALQQLERVSEGAVVTYTVNLVPGITAEAVAERFAEAGVADVASLRPLLTDRRFLAEVGVSAASIEGYLFPDPYTLPKGLSGREVLKRLVARYREVIAAPELEPDPNDPLTEHQRLVLASLIQKSRVLPSEWRLFAALLRNRLRIGLPLDMPAAEAYGRRHTPAGDKNRWSTRRPGLPPTPICSPGIDAIDAVVHPARSDARYMVARSNGTHVFCEDRECYRAAIRRWKMGLPPVPPGVVLGPDGLPLPKPPEPPAGLPAFAPADIPSDTGASPRPSVTAESEALSPAVPRDAPDGLLESAPLRALPPPLLPVPASGPERRRREDRLRPTAPSGPPPDRSRPPRFGPDPMDRPEEGRRAGEMNPPDRARLRAGGGSAAAHVS